MGERLTILCWLWSQPNGKAEYTAHHVNIWAAMVARHLSLDHELACATDMPAGIDPRVRIIPLPNDFTDVKLPRWGASRPQCLRRLSLFRPDAAQLFRGQRLISMDLDVVVTASLDPLFAGGEDFRICSGTWTNRLFNGSMYMLRAGSRPHVYTEFTAERAIEASFRHIGSDQAWLAHCLPDEKVWTPNDGVSFWMASPRPDARVTFFAGGTKPWALAEVGNAYCARHYRGQRAGRCLVLGYGPDLWTHLDAALAEPFDAVICSPEAAAHWPGPVLAIADDDAHAERLAVMHGFTDVVFCGRTMERDANVAA